MARLDMLSQVILRRKIIEVASDLTPARQRRSEVIFRLEGKGVVVRRHVTCATGIPIFIPCATQFWVLLIYLQIASAYVIFSMISNIQYRQRVVLERPAQLIRQAEPRDTGPDAYDFDEPLMVYGVFFSRIHDN